jgi:Na+-transporting NADH:ubiquinone oxidoreductase subunit NqrA
MDPEIEVDRINEKEYTVERIIQFVLSWVVVRKNSPESIRVYLSGIVASLVDHAETGSTPRAIMFKNAYEKNSSIRMMMKGHIREYGRNNSAHTRRLGVSMKFSLR